MIRHPGWGGLDVGFLPFLVEAKEACSSTDHWRREAALRHQEARSTLTTLNRGSRSTCMFKTKPSGQIGSARRSATVLAVTATSVSTSTLMLSR